MATQKWVSSTGLSLGTKESKTNNQHSFELMHDNLHCGYQLKVEEEGRRRVREGNVVM